VVDPGSRKEQGLGREVARVLVVGAAVVAVVLGAVVLTSFLPREIQEVVFHTPLAILVLLLGTAWLLWRISRRSDPR
jgi:heme A synthase